MAYVYSHSRKDTLQVFYIGIGSDSNFIRANETHNRNKHWINVFTKTGIIVEILHNNISWEEACIIEKRLICKYGRIDNKTGRLVNMTDGGEGISGYIMSEEVKLKISESKKGIESKLKGRLFTNRMTDETKLKISQKNIGKKRSNEAKNKMSKAKIGKPFSDIHKAKLSLARVGKFILGNHPNAKLIINKETGVFYPCAKEAAIAHGIRYETLIRFLNGSRRNKTQLHYC